MGSKSIHHQFKPMKTIGKAIWITNDKLIKFIVIRLHFKNEDLSHFILLFQQNTAAIIVEINKGKTINNIQAKWCDLSKLIITPLKTNALIATTFTKRYVINKVKLVFNKKCLSLKYFWIFIITVSFLMKNFFLSIIELCIYYRFKDKLILCNTF